MAARSKSTVVVTVLLVYGIYSTLLGLVMIVAPGFFFDTVGGFGPRNGHYIFDTAAFELPLGLLYLAAIRWPSWRVPVLAFATAHYVLHAISHLIDVNTANIHWVGVFDFVGHRGRTGDPRARAVVQRPASPVGLNRSPRRPILGPAIACAESQSGGHP
ncbi:hypothetical protein, partial [Mycobacterium sp.]|uniref:hypothetical protein n=1 Tax=Mycobacterium sp. TaxID=1785 RepID=UPI003C78177C